MSKRHRSQETVPPPRVELRAHAHNDGQAWRVEAHHNKERALKKKGRAAKRHWKTKDWKRRNVLRKQRALAFRQLAD